MKIPRLFSLKHCLRRSIWLCLCLSINILCFILYPTVQEMTQEFSEDFDILYIRSPLDKYSNESILQYFQWKEKQMRPSPYKTILHNTLPKSSNKTSYFIYEYTRHRQFCQKQLRTPIYISTCPYQNCFFTCNDTLIYKADAILMLLSHLNPERLMKLNQNRPANQIWLVWNDEPYPSPPVFNQFLFNWTITYRFDSEISVSSYGITFQKHKPMNQSLFDHWLQNNYEKQRNKAAWFVSNCNPKQRLQYYEQLKQYFPISAFGKCIQNQTNHSNNCTRASQCEFEHLLTSKFYLAFESTTARLDYITEKFWRALYHGTIPIVLGPKRHEYERVAPPYSFIYVNDYPDPQILAEYLHQISTDQNEYRRYHQWRMNYEVYYQAQHVEPVRFCELCYKLNTNRNRIWYNNMNEYFLETHQ